MPDSASIHAAGILVVDDRPAHLSLLEHVLRDAGYSNLHTTTDPFAVCALYCQHRFDLILLDLQMPGMDGFDVMSALLASDASGYVPILATTAEPRLRLRALRSGAKDFVAKPFDLLELTTRIYNMLEVRLLYKELEALAQKMKVVALRDELTGLPNRRLLLDRLHQTRLSLARSGHQACLMFLDLDHFKQINDHRGHDVGDLLLQQVAGRIASCLREGDSVSRMGGDEFVVLLEVLSPDQAVAATQTQRLAQRILKTLEQPYLLHGVTHVCTASVGMVLFSRDAPTVDALMKMADLAMYQAKAAGRNQCHFGSPLPPAPSATEPLHPAAQRALGSRDAGSDSRPPARPARPSIAPPVRPYL